MEILDTNKFIKKSWEIYRYIDKKKLNCRYGFKM